MARNRKHQKKVVIKQQKTPVKIAPPIIGEPVKLNDSSSFRARPAIIGVLIIALALIIQAVYPNAQIAQSQQAVAQSPSFSVTQPAVASHLDAVVSANNSSAIFAQNGTTTVRTYYYFNGQRVAMRVNGGEPIYLFGDQLGSASVAMQGNTVVAQQRYRPYGEEYNPTTNSLPTDYTFTGQRRENQNSVGSLMDYGGRFYSPQTGRFISADNLVPYPYNSQSWNRYSYVRNNPLRYVDPSGHADQPEGSMAIGGGAGLAPGGSGGGSGISPWWFAAGASAVACVTACPSIVDDHQTSTNNQPSINSPNKSGETGSPTGPNDPNGNQEDSVRNMLANRGFRQVYGVSDSEIRSNLGINGKTADFVGFDSNQGRWLVAESKGSDMDSAVKQLQNTVRGLFDKERFATINNTELRIYTNQKTLERMQNPQLGTSGWYVKDGYLGYFTDEAKKNFVYQTIDGMKVWVGSIP